MALMETSAGYEHPFFATDPYKGLPPSAETIRLQTVQMEHHPNYPQLEEELKQLAALFGVDQIGFLQAANVERHQTAEASEYVWAGYKQDHARAVVRKVVDSQGVQLSGATGMQIEVWYQPGMKYSTLRHELRHLAQLAHLAQTAPELVGTEYEQPLRFTEVWQRTPDGLELLKFDRSIPETAGLVTRNEAEVLEAHNLLADLKQILEQWQPEDSWDEVSDLIEEVGQEVLLAGRILVDWHTSDHPALQWFQVYFDNPTRPAPGGNWSNLLDLFREVSTLNQEQFRQWHSSKYRKGSNASA